MRSIVRNPFGSAAMFAALVAFSCPCLVFSQNSSYTQSGPANGVGDPLTPTQGSVRAGALDEAVNASATANVSAAAVSASVPANVQGAGLMGGSGGSAGTTGTSQGTSGSASERWGNPAATAGSSERWGNPTTASGTSAPGTSMASGNIPTFALKTQRTLGRAGLAAAAAQHTSMLATPAGQGLLSKAAGTKTAGMKKAGMKKAGESSPEGDDSEAEGQAADGANATKYSDDFPDSTKGTAVVSPPDLADSPLFAFKPSVGGEFPDLAQREFLIPTLHVGSQAGQTQQKEDLYQRIERRLQEYRTAENQKETSNNGLKKIKPFSSSSSTRTGLKKSDVK